ncbi:MAG TPA: PqqD family protein [Xanthobacteraceae bacterium]
MRDSEPVAASVNDEVFMLSLRAGAYFGLDPVGSEIWNLLSEPRRLGDLCATLSRIYDVDADTVFRDTSGFLETLLARGLLRVVDPVPEK